MRSIVGDDALGIPLSGYAEHKKSAMSNEQFRVAALRPYLFEIDIYDKRIMF